MNNNVQIKTKNKKNKIIYSILILFLLAPFAYNPVYADAHSGKLVDVALQIKKTKITLNIKNQSIKYILSEIEKITGFGYIIKSNTNTQSLSSLSLNVKECTVEEALNQLFTATDCTYEIYNNIITVVNKPQKKSTSTQQKQKQSLRGQVIEKDTKKPIAGVTIIEIGTTNGAISDEKGAFIISSDDSAASVEVAFMGMKSQIIKLSGDNTIITMEPDAMVVDDVVVTGIFSRKKESFTGSATTVTKRDLERTGSQNVFQSLKNLDPTLNIIDNVEFGSDPNKLPDMELRGTSSFPDVKNNYTTNPNLPLFILDGFETSVEKVYDLDMNRIESVTILKDAAAKSIYGSKAANGVIVIETTRIQSGEFHISYNGTLNLDMPDLSSYNLCDAREKLDLENALGYYKSNTPEKDLSLKELYKKHRNNVENGVNTDWLAQPVRTGVGHKHAINMEIGNEQLRLGADLSYNNIQGAMKGSLRTAILGGLTVIYQTGKLQFRNQLTFASTKATNSPYGDFSEYAKLNPYWKMKDETGNYLKELGCGPVFTTPVYNPLYNTTLNSKSTTEYFDLTNNFYAEWNINQAFKLTGRLGLTKKTSGAEDFIPGSHLKYVNTLASDVFNRGSYKKGNGDNFSVSGDLNLNFNKSFGKHMIFGNAGLNIKENTFENYIYEAQGFPNDKMDNIIFAKQYVKDAKPTGSESIDREVGALLVGNYSYEDRYLADVSYRATASSQFGSDKRWGGFWSGGLGWNIHNEKFFKNSNTINQLRLRFSVGNTGSQNFNSYQSMMLYNYFAEDIYLGRVGTYLEALANSDLQWQKKLDYNYGIDIKLWNRMEIRFDHYRAYTNDLLTDVTLPPSSGFTNYKANLGRIENIGYEFRVNYIVLKNVKDTYFSVFATGTANSNKIKEISNSLQTMNSDLDKESKNTNKPLVRFEEGQSLNTIWAVRSMGIDPASGKEIFLTKDGKYTDVWDANDKVACGDTEPKLMGTFGFNLDYKGLGLSVTMRYRLGGQIYNQTLINKVENAELNGNVDRRAYYDGWLKENDHVLYRAIGNWNQKTLATSRFVQDLNELDLSAISLSYDFYRHDFLKKCGIERMKVALNMNDVYKFSSVKVERGTSYPFARTMAISLQVNF